MSQAQVKRRGSNRHKTFGDMAEHSRKMDKKYDKDAEMQCRDWIEMMVGESVEWGVEHECSKPGDCFADNLDDGIVLCRIINEVVPGSVKKYHKGDKVSQFQKIENIGLFLNACMKEPFNCRPSELFDTPALYERQNIGQVVNGIQAFARRAHLCDKTVPLFGPKQHEKNPRQHEKTDL